MIYNGIDIEDISRFENKDLVKDSFFLKKIFTDAELEYCYKSKFPARHLAARFCAKEAVVKALSNLYDGIIPYSKIEVMKNPNQSVYIKVHLDGFDKYNISLSISHDKTKAIASVVVEY